MTQHNCQNYLFLHFVRKFTTQKDFKIKIVHLTQIGMLVSVLFYLNDPSSTEFIT